MVRLVAGKTRRQHTENPFESATLSINNPGEFAVADASELRAATLAAIAKSDARPDLRDAMQWVLAESQGLAAESLLKVRGLLGN